MPGTAHRPATKPLPSILVINQVAGPLTVELVAGHILASHRNVYDRVRKNVAAIGWGLQSLVPGQFPRSEIVEVPGYHESAMEGSVALWKLLERGLIAKEYADVKPLAVFAFPPSTVHANVSIRTIDDLKGLKIAAAGMIRGEVLSSLGAVPISLAPPQYYQSVSRGLVQGFFIPWTGIAPYRLNEVSKFSIDGPTGGAAGMIIMNKEVYAGLPTKAREAVDGHSGEKLVRRFAGFWDRVQAFGRKKFGGAKGHSIAVPKGAEKARMISLMSAVERDWVARTSGGAKVLEVYKTEVARVRSGS